jgi:hypothetical protein
MRARYVVNPKIEFVLDPPAETPSTQLAAPSWLGRIWSFVVDTLKKSSELQIREMTDRAGNTWWNVYDPTTGRSAWLDSEDEVRIWIEKNY